MGFEPTNNPATTQPTPAIPLTETPTSVQPTYLPTDNPTVTPEATTLRTLVCGMENKCSANDKTVEKTTVQAVRCCRDESHGGSGGWPFKCRSDSQATYSFSDGPWGQSKMDIIPDGLSPTGFSCVEAVFDDAVRTRTANNARLCTPQEIVVLAVLDATSIRALYGRALLGETDALVTTNAAAEDAVLMGRARENDDCAVLLIS